MDTQKLHDLIDKVIGKDGPLRTPAYWMRMVLKDMVNNITELKTWVGDAMLVLESKVKVLLANYIKSIPEYTYAKLKELKDKGLLIPGQKYMMTDYQCTTSKVPDYLEGYYNSDFAPSGVKLVLEALTSSQFSTDAYLISNRHMKYFYGDAHIKYIFDRTPFYYWCLKPSEVTMRVLDTTTGEEYSIVADFSEDTAKFVKEDNTSEVYGYFSLDSNFKVGYTYNFRMTNDGTDSRPTQVLSVTDTFKGLICRFKHYGYDIDLPFDPYIRFTFSIGSKNLVNKYVISKDSLNFRAIHIKPFVMHKTNDDSNYYELPRINLVPSQTLLHSFEAEIDENCTHICIDRVKGVRIARGCNYIKTEIGDSINIGRYCNHLIINNSSRLTIGEYCKNLYIIADYTNIGDYNQPSTEVTIQDQCLNIAPFTYSDSDKTLKCIAKDNNGNIRQWNPADFVDTVVPEEQTT